MAHVEKYKIFQKELVGTKDGNPFKDIAEIYEGKIRICLGGKQYMAVCMKEI